MIIIYDQSVIRHQYHSTPPHIGLKSSEKHTITPRDSQRESNPMISTKSENRYERNDYRARSKCITRCTVRTHECITIPILSPIAIGNMTSTISLMVVIEVGVPLQTAPSMHYRNYRARFQYDCCLCQNPSRVMKQYCNTHMHYIES